VNQVETARSSDYPASRISTPQRENKLLISPSHEIGQFDSHAVDVPFVFSLEGRQGMTYVGWDGIGYQTALSWNRGDGTWTAGQIIFPRDSTSKLRKFNSALTSIIRDNDLWSAGELRAIDGWFYGTFHTYPAAGYEAGPGTIGFARSRNLLEWEEVGTPLLPEKDSHWEAGGLYKSWLLEHDGLFYLFYNAKNFDDFGSTAVPPNWIEQTGLATSTDLMTWSRVTTNPVLPVGESGSFDDRFASDPCVLRDGDYWVMFYFGLSSDGHAREGYATSRDLHSWTKSKGILLDVGPLGSIDSLHAHKPAIVAWNGHLEHYYCAVAPREPLELSGYNQREQRGIARATGEWRGGRA
jgi:predicted GH43/DUF377 family glycosyl hydrolase